MVARPTRRAAAGDADVRSPRDFTRFRSRFDDAERENRLYVQQLPLQRRSTQAAAILVVVIALAQFPLAQVTGGRPITVTGSWALIVAAGVGVALAVAMSSDRSRRRTLALITAAAFVIPGICGVVIAAGADIAAQTILLVAGGVIVAYFSSRLDLLGTILTALTYSLITTTSWLLFGPHVRQADVAYSLFAVTLAHVIGISETRRMHREIRFSFAQREDFRRLSGIDVLTGLANRRAFAERLDAVWRGWKSAGRAPTVLMLDIDHFKKLNDSLGHQAGDAALRMVADTIRGCLRKGGDHQVARYGGEEFVVLLPSADHRSAHAIAERIATAVRGAGIERAVVPRGSVPAVHDTPLTVSIGIASADPTMSLARDLVDAADRALYRAKGDGRACVRCEDDDIEVAPRRS